jgi:hypothetical protein
VARLGVLARRRCEVSENEQIIDYLTDLVQLARQVKNDIIKGIINDDPINHIDSIKEQTLKNSKKKKRLENAYSVNDEYIEELKSFISKLKSEAKKQR